MLALAVVASLCALPVQEPVGTQLRRITFGSILGAAGDYDSDGVPDLLMGNLGNPARYQPPRLWVVSGANRSVLCMPTIPALAPASFGAQGGFDADGDGVPDILLTAGRSEKDSPSTLRILSGATGSTSMSIAVRGRVGRGGAWAHFVSDLDGDGLPDVGVLLLDPDLAHDKLAFFSGRSGLRISEIVVPNEGHAEFGGFVETKDRDGDARPEFAVLLRACEDAWGVLRLLSWTGPPVWEHFAPDDSYEVHAPVIVLGDVNGDGIDDLAAGFHERVDIVGGLDGRFLRVLDPEPATGADQGFGRGLAALGDINGDGVPDLAVSVTEARSMWEGTVRAISATSGDVLWETPTGHQGVWHFGRPLVAVGDIDGDGTTELIAAADHARCRQPGFVALISGRTGTILRQFSGSADDSW